ncbi:MAG: T9SS type A sorting domain-containing protein [Candidatus Kapaibacteriota bacterium]
MRNCKPNEKADLFIYNVLGKVVLTQKNIQPNAEGSILIQNLNLLKGLYFSKLVHKEIITSKTL